MAKVVFTRSAVAGCGLRMADDELLQRVLWALNSDIADGSKKVCILIMFSVRAKYCLL